MLASRTTGGRWEDPTVDTLPSADRLRPIAGRLLMISSVDANAARLVWIDVATGATEVVAADPITTSPRCGWNGAPSARCWPPSSGIGWSGRPLTRAQAGPDGGRTWKRSWQHWRRWIPAISPCCPGIGPTAPGSWGTTTPTARSGTTCSIAQPGGEFLFENQPALSDYSLGEVEPSRLSRATG